MLYKKKLTHLFCLLLLCCFFSSLQGQETNSQQLLIGARKNFEALEYTSAIVKLQKLLSKDSMNVEAQEMLATSYRKTRNYPGALKSYSWLISRKNIKNEWALYYAESLANNEQYEQSEKWYRRFLALSPGDRRAAAFTSTNLKNLVKNSANWSIGFLNINSQAAEYSPTFYKQGLLFSSNRQSSTLTKHIFRWDNTPFTQLYYVPEIKSIKVINPDSFINSKNSPHSQKIKYNDDDTEQTSNDSRILSAYRSSIERDTLGLLEGQEKFVKKLGGRLENKYHNASAAVFPDGAIIYTRNNYNNGRTAKSADGIVKLKLFTVYGPNLNLVREFPYNGDDFSTGHPAISADGNILVFSSDRPGGFGGTDLYYCVRSGQGDWTKPINLGKEINTEGNEMFPYLDKSGNLYFSSTGLAGFGGLDLFYVELKDMKPSNKPVNMGNGINSPTDDFGLIITPDDKIGYFSSNRRGNDDIYQFKRSSYKITLQGIVTDARTRIPLAGSRLLMRHLDGIDTIRTDNKGRYKRDLPLETDYEVTAQKLSYVNGIHFASSVGIQKDSVINLNIQLDKTENAQQYILNHCDSLKKVYAVKNIYYDLDRSEIRGDAKPALEELATLMRKYPDIRVITSSHCDSRASEQYNRSLSLRRGESAKAFLIARGIRADRIRVEYYGKTRLVNRCYDGINCSEEDQQLNRRTEFDVILQGVNITQQNCADQ